MASRERYSLIVCAAFVSGVIGIVGLAASAHEIQRRRREVANLNSIIRRQVKSCPRHGLTMA